MSDVSNDEIKEILDNIRKRTDAEIDSETVRQWSREDIDRLLRATRRAAAVESETEADPVAEETVEEEIVEEEIVEETVFTEEEPDSSYVEDILPPVDDGEEEFEEDTAPAQEHSGSLEDRIKSILNNEAPKEKKNGFKSLLKGAKGKASALAEKVKDGSKKMFASAKPTDASEDEDEYSVDEDDPYEDEFESAEISVPDEDDDSDMKIADFSDSKKDKAPAEDEYVEEKTRFIDVNVSEEDSETEAEKQVSTPVSEKSDNDLYSSLIAAQESGQMVMEELKKKAEELKPEKIDENEAEKELFEKRKKKIETFILFGEDGDPYGSDVEREHIGELFDTHDDRPARPKEAKTFDGLEYDETKDARRVSRYLTTQKKKSFKKTVGLLALFAVSLILGIATSTKTTVGGDRIMTIFMNLVIIMIALVVSGQSILSSFELLKQKKFNINTMISAASIVCFVQTLLMFILYFFDKNAVSVFGCAGVGLLLLGEINTYVMNCRTADAMEVCSGDNKDKLYSIESITDDKDIVELGKNIQSKSPRLRYSCKTRFPSHLIEMCMSETSADKRAKIYFAAAIILSVINLVVAWVVNRHFSVGFAAFTISLVMCVPAYGALLVQLPLRWANVKLNKSGAMISSQNAVNELYKTNAIILDSKDLFDQSACTMVSFNDFKNVWVDDAKLYAAAMIIRSGGPLTGVFDRMYMNRRDIMPTVKSFSYEEKMGVSGWICNQKVILGNKTMMHNHNISVPVSVDEDKYLMHGQEVMYLAIANQLAAMIVVEYAPNQKIADYLKKLRDSGVSILVRNCDPNVTERMISDCYDMRLDNIRIINSASGRVFKKYKSRPKAATRAVSVHDGSTYTFAQSLCTAAMLRHTFKVTDTLAAVGIAMGFLMVVVLAILDVIKDMPIIFVLLMQAVVAGAFTGITRISGGK